MLKHALTLAKLELSRRVANGVHDALKGFKASLKASAAKRSK